MLKTMHNIWLLSKTQSKNQDTSQSKPHTKTLTRTEGNFCRLLNNIIGTFSTCLLSLFCNLHHHLKKDKFLSTRWPLNFGSFDKLSLAYDKQCKKSTGSSPMEKGLDFISVVSCSTLMAPCNLDCRLYWKRKTD